MAEKKYINSVVAMFENAQKTMGELLDGATAGTLFEWTVADLTLCKTPAIKKTIKGRIVMYNKAEGLLFIEDLASCVLNDVCGIINEIRWHS